MEHEKTVVVHSYSLEVRATVEGSRNKLLMLMCFNNAKFCLSTLNSDGVYMQTVHCTAMTNSSITMLTRSGCRRTLVQVGQIGKKASLVGRLDVYIVNFGQLIRLSLFLNNPGRADLLVGKLLIV